MTATALGVLVHLRLGHPAIWLFLEFPGSVSQNWAVIEK